VEKEEVMFVVEGEERRLNEVMLVELSRVDALVICTGGKAQVGPGHPGPEEIEEAKQDTPKKNVAARTR
jgi:hypothetical protein